MASHFQPFFVNALSDAETNKRSGPYALVLEQFLSAFSSLNILFTGECAIYQTFPLYQNWFSGQRKFRIHIEGGQKSTRTSAVLEVDNARVDEKNKTAERLWFQRGNKAKDGCDFLKDGFLEHKLIYVVELHLPGNHVTTSKPASWDFIRANTAANWYITTNWYIATKSNRSWNCVGNMAESRRADWSQTRTNTGVLISPKPDLGRKQATATKIYNIIPRLMAYKQQQYIAVVCTP